MTNFKGRQISYKQHHPEKKHKNERQCRKIEFDKEFVETASCKDTKSRSAFDALLKFVHPHDTVYVQSLESLAVSIVGLQKIVEQIFEKGASLFSIEEDILFEPSTEDSKFTHSNSSLLRLLAKFESNIIKHRQALGIADAKRKGAYKGRKTKHSLSQRKKIVMEANKVRSKKDKIRVRDICLKYKISHSTLRRYRLEI